MTAVAQTLGVSRSNLAERLSRPLRHRGPYRKQDDLLLQMMRPIIDSRPTYGYRRVTALLNRELQAQGSLTVNAKRVLRIMRAHDMTLTAYTAQRPGRTQTASYWPCDPTFAGAPTIWNCIAVTAQFCGLCLPSTPATAQ